MPIISQVYAPDLSGLPAPVMSEYILNMIFLGAGTQDQKAGSYVVSLIHATDKAIREYSAGRDLLVLYASSANRTRLLIEGLGRFETCINSIKRALRFVERLSSEPSGPAVDRSLHRLLESYGQTITPIRDAVEHMDAALASESLKEGEAKLLALSADGRTLEISSSTLSFETLVLLLRRLHSLALDCARFKEEQADDTKNQSNPALNTDAQRAIAC